jgi:hypothetical protein
MKTILRISVLVFLLIGFANINSLAQSFDERAKYQIDSLNAARAKLSKNEQKISSQIYKVLLDYENEITAGKTKTEAFHKFNRFSIQTDNSERIYVNVLLLPSNPDRNTVEDAIEKNGGDIHASKTYIITCWIPADKIRVIAALPSVTVIEQVHPWKKQVITSAGDVQLQANTARSTFNVDTVIVKVGVISDGIANLTQVQNAGELPNVTVPLNGTAGGTTAADNEGTAMLEIIHDLAPGALLYFDGFGLNEGFSEFDNRIDALNNAGCKIIVDDIAFPYDEPYFSDQSDAGIAISKFITLDGGVYVSAADNYAQNVYGGVTDFSGNLTKFQSGNTYLQVTLPAKPANDSTRGDVILQWKDSWLSPVYDYDISVYNLNGTLVSTGGNNTQGSGVPPREIATFYNNTNSSQTYNVKVSTNYIGSEISNEEFKIYFDGGTIINGTTINQIFGHPAYPGVISVAAYHADAQTAIASYSSHGPATIYSLAQQRWLVAQNVPTITATSKVETYVGSSGLWQDPNGATDPFQGTSAAAPHVAAIAALFFQAFPSLTNQDFYNNLTATGTAVGTNTGNHQWTTDAGFGKANALAALQHAAGTVATPQFNPTQGTFNSTVNVQITCATQGATIYYTKDTTTPTTSSFLYNANDTIHITSTTTIRAKAFKNGLVSSNVNTAVYTISSGIVISQVDENNTAFGWYGVMPTNQSGWNYYRYDEHIVFNLSGLSYVDVLAQQNFKPGSVQKYNRWEAFAADVYTKNYTRVTLRSTSGNITGRFKSTSTAYLTTALDGASMPIGTLGFNDPWRIDSTGPGYYGPLNRGTDAIWYNNLSAPETLDTASIFKGIFLNQGSPNWTTSYYSVNAPLTKTATLNGNSVPAYFVNWGGSNVQFQNSSAAQTGVIFSSSGATAIANYKGVHLSSSSSAYANDSQRKFARTTDGRLHMVYESLGHVWYEISSDSGRTWTIANNNKPLDAYGGKLPAIDCGGDNHVVIVWEERQCCGSEAVQLKIALFLNQSMFPGYPLIAFEDGDQGYSQNLNPIIAYDYEGKAVIAWENKVNSVYPIGIITKHGVVPTARGFQSLPPYTQDPYRWFTDYTGTILSTDINCTNPTISAAKNPTDQYNMIYGLAWQYNQSATSSYIHYRKLTFNSDSVSVSSDTNISSGDGFPLNYKPSIIAVQNGTARVCWIGANTNTNIYETVFRDPGNYRFWLFSYKVASVSINATDDNSAYYVAWSRNATGNNYVNQYTDSGTLSHISTANSTGQDIQLCNGYNKSSTYFCSFSPNTLPYPFTTSNSLNNFSKINPNGINSDRGSVISKRSAQFFYSFGDLAVDNNNIAFIKAPDTVNFNNLDKINNVLVTNPFTINNNSAIVFSECSGVIDSLTALSVLGDTGYVSFKSELIDNSTNNVIGTIRDSRINAGELHDYNIASYNLNTDGLNGKTVKVKVTISTNIDSINSALTEHYADGNTVGKATVKSITLQKPGVITEYALGQNYPNPFNPTTVINYQLPKDGLVTIKIYDVLGNEIRTLVNDNRSIGKYSVNFDGSKIASGVYFYQLRVSGGASNFVTTKKMLLIK